MATYNHSHLAEHLIISDGSIWDAENLLPSASTFTGLGQAILYLISSAYVLTLQVGATYMK
jgi:hypothetical protein